MTDANKQIIKLIITEQSSGLPFGGLYSVERGRINLNKEEALQIFHQYDDPIRWEYPEGFDYPSAVSRARDFVAVLDKITGNPHEFETESYIQDASFHSRINLGFGWLRFSNFGNMVSIAEIDPIEKEIVVLVQKLCEREDIYLSRQNLQK